MVDFASNALYIAPVVEPYLGEPTKVAPTDAQRANGFVPEQPFAAEHLNYELNLLSKGLPTLHEGAALCNLVARTSGVATGLGGICWDEQTDQFIAVGASGVILTSPHGRQWTSRTSGVATELVAVASNSSIIVAVGASGVIRTSPDGVTWTGRTSGTAARLNAVTWFAAASLFIVVGSGGVILTSPDGITWTSRTSGTAVDLVGVTSNGSLAVAVGGDGFVTPVTRSANGTSWTNQNITSGPLASVAWSARFGLFCAAGGFSNPQTSPDGVTWTARTDPTGTGSNAVLATDRHIVLIGAAFGGTWLSKDGITWFFGDGLTTDVPVAAAWNGRVAVLVGASGLVLNSQRVTIP
jgi:hypothetical protein